MILLTISYYLKIRKIKQNTIKKNRFNNDGKKLMNHVVAAAAGSAQVLLHSFEEIDLASFSIHL